MGCYKKIIGFLLMMLLTHYGVHAGTVPDKSSTTEESRQSASEFNETKKDTLPVSDSSSKAVATTGSHFTNTPTALGLNGVGKIVHSNISEGNERKKRQEDEVTVDNESSVADDPTGTAGGAPPASGSASSSGSSAPGSGASAGGATSAPGGGTAPAPGGDKSTTTKAPDNGVTGLFNWQTYILLLTVILTANQLCVYLNSCVP